MNNAVDNIFEELEIDLKSCFLRYKRSFSYKRGPYSLDWLSMKRRNAESDAVGRIMELQDCKDKTNLVRNVHKRTDEIEYDHFGVLNRSWKEMR